MEIHTQESPLVWGFWERLTGITKTAIKKVLGRCHISLSMLETIIVEIEATLNDCPLTFVSSELGDPEPLTPANLLHGRRITCLPHQDTDIDELQDPTYSEASQLRARLQTAVLTDFKKRWHHEYLTSLREHHEASGENQQTVRKGDVVIVHDDNPRATWKMAVVDELLVGKDKLVRAANIRTSTGITSRPITKLYPIVVNGGDKVPFSAERTETLTYQPNSNSDQCNHTNHRSQRASARRATDRVKEWVRLLSAPRRMLRQTNCNYVVVLVIAIDVMLLYCAHACTSRLNVCDCGIDTSSS